VRARLVVRAEDWPWSSARALLGLGEDPLIDLAPARQRFARFADLLEAAEDGEATARLRKGETVGRRPDLPRRFGGSQRPSSGAAEARAEVAWRGDGLNALSR